MKKTLFTSILCIFVSFSLFSQQNNYYYYQSEKIFLQQSLNKIFLKFAPNANQEQIRSLVSSNPYLKLTANTSMEGNNLDFAVLETKNRNDISFAVIESFKANPVVVSATPLFLYNEVLQGLTGEFVVKLKEATSYKQMQELAEKNNCKVGQENEFVKNQFMIYVSKKSNIDALQMSNLFYKTGLFEFSEPNFIILNAFSSNDKYFDYQWALRNTGQYGGTSGIDIKAEQAWAITQGSSNIKVAVVDQGVDLTHPDLQANLLLGYDASGNSSGGAPVWADDNHGTACAGIIGAVKDNVTGISGVAPNCKIIPIHTSDAYGYLPYDWAANSIQWAWQNGADVISNSWGGGSPMQVITNAINAAVTQGRNGLGCILAFCTQNQNSSVAYPATLPNVIAVGAMSPCGERKSPSSCDGENWGSNYGAELDIVAPGVLIPTTDRQGNAGYNPNRPIHLQNGGNKISNDYTDQDYTVWFNGTSAATPHVAGVAALVLSVNPDLTAQQVRDIIESTAQKVGNYTYSTASGHTNGTWNNEMGYGLADAYAAVEKATCTVNYANQIVESNTTVTSCGDINVQNVRVRNGAKLTLNAAGNVSLGNGFEVESGSKFEIK